MREGSGKKSIFIIYFLVLIVHINQCVSVSSQSAALTGLDGKYFFLTTILISLKKFSPVVRLSQAAGKRKIFKKMQYLPHWYKKYLKKKMNEESLSKKNQIG